MLQIKQPLFYLIQCMIVDFTSTDRVQFCMQSFQVNLKSTHHETQAEMHVKVMSVLMLPKFNPNYR